MTAYLGSSLNRKTNVSKCKGHGERLDSGSGSQKERRFDSCYTHSVKLGTCDDSVIGPFSFPGNVKVYDDPFDAGDCKMKLR